MRSPAERPPRRARRAAPLRAAADRQRRRRRPRVRRADASSRRRIEPELVNEVGDDRDDIQPGDRVLLIVENDLGLRPLPARRGPRARASRGWSPRSARPPWRWPASTSPTPITLDIHLPDIDGWRVLERLKNDLATRHIPVCVISTDEARDRALASGALAFVAKPIQSRDVLDELLDHTERLHLARRRGSVLVVEPDAERREQIVELPGGRRRAGHGRRRRDRRRSSCCKSSRSTASSSVPTVTDAGRRAGRRPDGDDEHGLWPPAGDRLRRRGRRRRRLAPPGRRLHASGACTRPSGCST